MIKIEKQAAGSSCCLADGFHLRKNAVQQKESCYEESNHPSKSLSRLYPEFTPGGKSAATIEKYSRDVAQFVHWAGQVPVTKALVAAWKEALPEKGYAPATVNGKLTALDRFLTFWGWEDCRVKHVTCQRKLFREDRRELTREEYFRLVNAASGKPRLMLLLETICATGIRVSEVKYITLEAARQGRAEITLKGKVRTILLPGKLCRKLLKLRSEEKHTFWRNLSYQRWEASQPKKHLGRNESIMPRCRGGGEQSVSPQFAASFAKCFYDACRDLVKLADVLGHSSVETMRIYLLSTGTQHVKLLDRLGLVGETKFTFCLKLSHFVHSDEMPNLVQTNG